MYQVALAVGSDTSGVGSGVKSEVCPAEASMLNDVESPARRHENEQSLMARIPNTQDSVNFR